MNMYEYFEKQKQNDIAKWEGMLQIMEGKTSISALHRSLFKGTISKEKIRETINDMCVAVNYKGVLMMVQELNIQNLLKEKPSIYDGAVCGIKLKELQNNVEKFK